MIVLKAKKNVIHLFNDKFHLPSKQRETTFQTGRGEQNDPSNQATQLSLPGNKPEGVGDHGNTPGHVPGHQNTEERQTRRRRDATEFREQF